MTTLRHVLLAALLLATLALSGCATVRPWDRDLLAKKSMRFVPLPHEMAVDDHIYFSKEGSTGGMDAAGGGCGCN
jgi:predicted small secreted protein